MHCPRYTLASCNARSMRTLARRERPGIRAKKRHACTHSGTASSCSAAACARARQLPFQIQCIVDNRSEAEVVACRLLLVSSTERVRRVQCLATLVQKCILAKRTWQAKNQLPPIFRKLKIALFKALSVVLWGGCKNAMCVSVRVCAVPGSTSAWK